MSNNVLDARQYLRECEKVFNQRGEERDQKDERSFTAILRVFHAIQPSGRIDDEYDAALFMVAVKLGRNTIKPSRDGFIDGINYLALAAEAWEQLTEEE